MRLARAGLDLVAEFGLRPSQVALATVFGSNHQEGEVVEAVPVVGWCLH